MIEWLRDGGQRDHCNDAGCERLIVACADWEPGAAPTRNLWRLAATVASARRLGLAVDVEPSAVDAAGPLDRFLARLVRSGRVSARG